MFERGLFEDLNLTGKTSSCSLAAGPSCRSRLVSVRLLRLRSGRAPRLAYKLTENWAFKRSIRLGAESVLELGDGVQADQAELGGWHV